MNLNDGVDVIPFLEELQGWIDRFAEGHWTRAAGMLGVNQIQIWRWRSKESTPSAGTILLMRERMKDKKRRASR